MTGAELTFAWVMIAAVACLVSRWLRILRRAMPRRFICYYYFISWWHWSLGIHFDPYYPQIEIHLPGGFIRVGLADDLRDHRPLRTRSIGLVEGGVWRWRHKSKPQLVGVDDSGKLLWEDENGESD